MKKNLTIFIITSFLLNNVAYAQNPKFCFIVDKDTRASIPYASIFYYKGKNQIDGSYADEKGKLNLSNKDFDSVEVSCIGFQPSKIEDSNVLNRDTIYLERKSVKLEEVLILKNHAVETIALGYSEYKKGILVNSQKGIEVSSFIENSFKSQKTIKSFLFKVKRRKYYSSVVRVHLYKKNMETFEPGEEIITKDIIKYIDGKAKGLVEVDLSEFGLELPLEGAFIGIEWLGIVDENLITVSEEDKLWSDIAIEYNYSMSKPVTFTRFRLKSNKWIDTNYLKKTLRDIGSENYPNASFGIKIFKD